MSEVVIGRRYTVVIPKSVREKIDIKEGQKVLVKVEENRIIIEPLPSNPYSILERIIKEPYNEREEAKIEKWLRKYASS
ncbi:AbrB/MazE/SpoVT family DNA-binding domain-containing protein [Candidatus Bathyarchaeota archaeon]|nr:MAG: AbrB/MazE/SpoVT family DNA-binding domain-containing protein [Candidatus Bathyarchaeota archaeon]